MEKNKPTSDTIITSDETCKTEREVNIRLLVENFKLMNIGRGDEARLAFAVRKIKEQYENEELYSDMKLANMVLINC